MQGLPRYDAETFRSLRRVENPSMQIFPSVHIPGEPNLQELAVMPGTPVSFTSRSRPLDNTFLMKPEPVHWPEILFNNTHIGMHRFYYLLTRLPGAAMLMLSTWVVWGRGANTPFLLDSEKGMGISAVTVAAVVLVGSIFGSMNHNDSNKRAFYQIVYRSIVSLANICGIVVVLVFSAVVVSKLSDTNDSVKYINCKQNGCYSRDERMTNAAVMLGLSVMILVFSVLTFIHAVFGAYKLSSVSKKSKQEKIQPEVRRPRIQAAFNNAGMIGESDYY